MTDDLKAAIATARDFIAEAEAGERGLTADEVACLRTLADFAAVLSQPTPPEPPGDVVEIVFAEIQKAWFQNGSRLERTYALIAALRAADRLVEPGHVAVPVDDLHVALTLAADSSPSAASSQALNRLCDAIAAARNEAATSEEKAR